MTNKNQHFDEEQWAHLLDVLAKSSADTEGELSEEERIQLETLRQLVSNTEEALALYNQLDVEKGWTELRNLAKQRQLIADSGADDGGPSIYNKHVGTRRLVAKFVAAASILLVVGLGIFYLYERLNPTPTRNLLAEAQHIEAGGNKARLILGDGNIIDLREDFEGITVHEQGISYLDGELVMGELTQEEYVTLEVPRTGEYQIDLPDGTRVWLNAESSLKYPVRFQAHSRKVELTGEAYFEVAHRPEQPFIVATANQEISVLGTQFNVQAYQDESISVTTLIEGSVRVRPLNQQGSVLLQPGMQALSDFRSIKTAMADVDQVMAWKNGKFAFHGQDLSAIMRQIARWYDVDVQFANDQLRQLKFGGTVSRDNHLASVLEAMRNTGKLSFDLHGKTLIVRNAI